MSSTFSPEKSTGLMANPIVSRRTFFSLTAAVGALTFLGSVFDTKGNVITAWADENSAVHFVIYILGRDEVPIMCFDVEGDTKKPVEGMKVTITSLNNQETLTAETDENGFTPVRIRPLSQQADDDAAFSYSFYGRVLASKTGYRSYCEPECYICSGVPSSSDGTHNNAIEIPTHPVEQGDIYLRTAALDGADVQYSAAECYVGPDNTIEHTFEIVAKGPTLVSITAEVVLVAPDGTETTWGEAVLTPDVDSGPVHRATFTGAWLKDAQPGSMLKVKFGKTGDRPYVMTSPVSFVPTIGCVDAGFEDTDISPGQDGDKETAVCPIPAWILDAGDTLNVAFPMMPVTIFGDNKGNLGLTVTLLQYTFLKRRNGENKLEDKDKFKSIFGGLTGKKAWDAYKKELDKSLEGLENCLDDALANKSTYGSTPITSKIDGTFKLQAMAYLSWKPDDKLDTEWTGDFAMNLELAVSALFTKQFIYLVPFYLSIDLAAKLNAKLALGMKFKGLFRNVHYGHTLGVAPLAVVVVLHLEAGLTIALGVAGIASLGFRGSAYFHLEFVFDEVAGKTSPHITGALAAQVEVMIQVFFLKKTYLLYDTPKWTFLDNWSDKSKLEDLESQILQTTLPLSDFSLEGATVVTEDELAHAASYAVTLRPVTSEELLALGDAAASAPEYISEFTPLRQSINSDENGAYLGFKAPYNAQGETTYNPKRGLKPASVTKIFADEYSNSRLKVKHGYAGYVDRKVRWEPVLAARLVTVTIPDDQGESHAVTRVALVEWDYDTNSFGGEQVIEISVPGVSPWERNDVDFDFDLAPSVGHGDVAFFGITSVVRPEIETAENYEMQQFVSMIGWHIHQTAEWNQLYSVQRSLHGLLEQGYATSSPRLVMQCFLSAHDPEANPAAPWLYYYKTNVDTGETTLNLTVNWFSENRLLIDDLVVINPRFSQGGLTSEDFRHGSFEVYTMDRVKPRDGDNAYASGTVLGWTGRNSKLPTPKDMGAEGEGAPESLVCSFLIGGSSDIFVATEKSSVLLRNVSSLTRRTVQGSTEAPFVFQYDGTQASTRPYYQVKVETESLKISLEEMDGSSETNRFFPSHDGKWLYAVRAVDHEIPGLSDQALDAVDQGGKVYSGVYKDDDNYGDVGDVPMTGGRLRTYELLEARLFEGLGSYYQFYPIAQLDFCPDNIDIISHLDGRRDFIMSTISAVDKNDHSLRYDLTDTFDMNDVYHVADVYHVSVPLALGLHVDGIKAVSPYGSAGEKSYLSVELSNIGNWFITGFEVDFFGPDDRLLSTASFDDLENRVQDTHENYHSIRDEEGTLRLGENGRLQTERVEDRFDGLGMMSPGATRTYCIDFTIPEDVSGEVSFAARIKNPHCTPNSKRESWINDDDYLPSAGAILMVDPNLHGIPHQEPSGKEHTWSFSGQSAPYAMEGDDPQPLPRGDVNGNGTVNIIDAQAAYDIANGKYADRSDYSAMRARADVNSDNAVDASDAFAIQHAIHFGWDEK